MTPQYAPPSPGIRPTPRHRLSRNPHTAPSSQLRPLPVPTTPPPTSHLRLPRSFEGATRVAADEAERYLEQHPGLASNGKADVLLIPL